MRTWTVDDVMTQAVVSVDQAASYRSMVDLLIERRISAAPVVDAFQRVSGVVSEADLLRKIEYAGDEEPRLFDGRRRRGERDKALASTAAGLMSTPAVTVLRGTPIAAAARLMDSEKVKRLPVVDDLGRLVGIVTRGDLLKVHLRPDDDIHADVRATVVHALAGRIEDATVEVTDGVVTLNGRVDRATNAGQAVHLARQVPGVVSVIDKLTYELDDRSIIGTGIPY
jgi:CBS-domain-containing membrane protein